MLFLIGQLKIQLILFCHLAGIVNRKPARSSAGTPLPTPSVNLHSQSPRRPSTIDHQIQC
ncbi:hypothetical protein I7I53_00993 [Histoplasma capsulatum var. duboisii H88]|uniref:Uncharacterized protein n=1 Tax=Ajellomyces capsulatus (strain H88) TaxID=544711 RepID=A0A8A1LI27_AJEC8|nr:hypothetical protein I7I53_00993 [Histoplasma capsulatum var. duboisii H88]